MGASGLQYSASNTELCRSPIVHSGYLAMNFFCFENPLATQPQDRSLVQSHLCEHLGILYLYPVCL